MPETSRRRVSVVLFDGFELLDVFGPLEVFSMLADQFEVTLVGPAAGEVRSIQGTRIVADVSYANSPAPNIVMVPGGYGTRSLVHDAAWLAWLCSWALSASIVTSVCTGSALLAAAGLLDGYRATSNRLAFNWVRTQGKQVTWVEGVRWVEDRDRWTSAGVSAGIDMTLALVRSLFGEMVARDAATRMEYDWHDQPGL